MQIIYHCNDNRKTDGGAANLKKKSPIKKSKSDSNSAEKGKEVNSPPKQDFIHVRARRGQATDSHSLAERVRYPNSKIQNPKSNAIKLITY